MFQFLATQWRVLVDYTAATMFLYVVLHPARDARALRTAVAILVLHLGSLVARNSELLITSWVLEASALIGVGVLVFAFHSELRYALVRFNALFRLWPNELRNTGGISDAIVHAIFQLAETRVGALIVMVGQDPVADLLNCGVQIGASVTSSELLVAIFQKSSPLHDGAVVIERGRIVQARAVLPLSEDAGLQGGFGTRHRAGMGVSQRCDALVIAVSEQRGEVTVMQSGRATVIHSREHMAERLRAFDRGPTRQLVGAVRRMFKADLKLKSASAALAAVALSVSYLATETSVRVVSVPVQFIDVPPSTIVSGLSVTHIVLQLRGAKWLMESAHPSRLVAHFSLKGAKDGVRSFRLPSLNVDLPPGIVLERATPAELNISIARSPGYDGRLRQP